MTGVRAWGLGGARATGRVGRAEHNEARHILNAAATPFTHASAWLGSPSSNPKPNADPSPNPNPNPSPSPIPNPNQVREAERLGISPAAAAQLGLHCRQLIDTVSEP